MKRMIVTLEVTVPSGTLISDVKEYVDEAVEVWYGQRHPDDWSHDLKLERISVCVQPKIIKSKE